MHKVAALMCMYTVHVFCSWARAGAVGEGECGLCSGSMLQLIPIEHFMVRSVDFVWGHFASGVSD